MFYNSKRRHGSEVSRLSVAIQVIAVNWSPSLNVNYIAFVIEFNRNNEFSIPAIVINLSYYIDRDHSVSG